MRDILRKVNIKSTTEPYPRNRLRDRSRKTDIKFLATEPFVEVNLNMSFKERQKKEDSILIQIRKTVPSDNDTFHIEHNRENSTFVLK